MPTAASISRASAGVWLSVLVAGAVAACTGGEPPGLDTSIGPAMTGASDGGNLNVTEIAFTVLDEDTTEEIFQDVPILVGYAAVLTNTSATDALTTGTAEVSWTTSDGTVVAPDPGRTDRERIAMDQMLPGQTRAIAGTVHLPAIPTRQDRSAESRRALPRRCRKTHQRCQQHRRATDVRG